MSQSLCSLLLLEPLLLKNRNNWRLKEQNKNSSSKTADSCCNNGSSKGGYCGKNEYTLGGAWEGDKKLWEQGRPWAVRPHGAPKFEGPPKYEVYLMYKLQFCKFAVQFVAKRGSNCTQKSHRIADCRSSDSQPSARRPPRRLTRSPTLKARPTLLPLLLRTDTHATVLQRQSRLCLAVTVSTRRWQLPDGYRSLNAE